MENLTGYTLGQYEILELIGRGGMANVYRGVQKSIGREVAIKVLPAHFLQDSTFLERFNREVQVIARLEHPRILPVHDFGEQGGLPFIVMRYLTGGSLADRIKQADQGMLLDEVVYYVGQIAEGLDFAHRRGIIHRDFKPSNVLLDEEGNAYLGDFGIAKVSEATAQLTGSGIVGTPAYMAPEMTDVGSTSPLVDVYAVGVTLYQMLTGRLPYESDTPMGLLMAHVAKPVPDAREVRPGLPDGVQVVIERTMAKDPAQRYRRAGELAEALQNAVVTGYTLLEPASPGMPAEDVIEPMTEPMVEAITLEPEPPIPPTIDARPEPDTPTEFQGPAVGAPPTIAERPTPRRRVPAWVWVGGAVTGAVVLVGVLALLGVLALGGIFGGGEGAPALEEATAPLEEEEVAGEPAEEPGERTVAVFIWTQEFDTLNPWYTNMWFSSITQQLWLAWAWDFDENNAPRPVLITEIPSVENGGISEDGTVITMKLRDDIVWSDGEPITSADFVFTYEMIVNPNNTVASVYPYDLMTGVEVPDERTVVMNFEEPFAPWVATLWHGILPKHILEPVFEAEGTIDNAEWNLAPTVGAGPFVFAEWESGSFARFVANDNYWLGKPKLDEIFIRFVPDDASQINALVAGDGHVGTFFAYSQVSILERAGVEIITVQSGYNEGWYPYLGEDGHPALQDVRVRQAIAMAFDRAKICEDLLLGLTKPAATFWDNTPYGDPSIEPWPYDPERANELLDEAGWVDTNGDGIRDRGGINLVLSYGTTTREVRQDTQAVAQQQLAEVGIGLELLNFDSDLYFATDGPAARGELDIMEWSDTTEFPDPTISYWLISEIPTEDYPVGVNWQRIADEELDALFWLQQTQVDFTERQQTFYKISKLVYEQVYWLGLWQDPDLFGVSEKLKNVKLSGVTPFFNIMEWELVE